MNYSNSKYFQYKRIFFLSIIKIIITLTIIIKFFFLQILSLKQYRKIAHGNSTRLFYILKKRGSILDRNGNILAESFEYYKISFIKSVKNWAQVIKMVFQILKRKNVNVEEIIQRATLKFKKNKHQSLTIAKYLTQSELKRIRFYSYLTPGANISKGTRRSYALENACHVIGVVGRPNKNSLIYKNEILNDEDFKIGKSGLEEILENKIKDTPDEKLLITDSRGFGISDSLLRGGRNGKDASISLDFEIQQNLGKLMEGKKGAAVLIEIETGQVLAMQSSPIFDPNKFSLGLDLDEIGEATFMNKVISSSFAPGSIFKTIIGYTALKNGLNPNEIFKCKGAYKIGNRAFRCHKEEGHGNVNFVSAIERSCNCYFYNIAKYFLSLDSVYETARIFGFGKKTGIEIKTEKTPILYNEASFYDRFGGRCMTGDLANVSIGQGVTSATPIQLCILMARIASNKDVQPTLFLKKPEFESLILDETYLHLIRLGLLGTVNTPKSSLYHLRPKEFLLAAKSGTSQSVSKYFTKQQIRRGEVDYKDKAHSVFAGYAPFDKPKYAISVLIEHGGWGSGFGSAIGISMLKTALAKYT